MELNKDVENLVFEAAQIAQKVIIKNNVVKYIDQYRQKFSHSKENGGQLFGSVMHSKICIQAISGPYLKDFNSRCSYRSSLNSAQKEIINQHKQGKIYLGEWHTHPEKTPSPSQSDLLTINEIQRFSKLNLNGLLMLIAGNGDDPREDFLAFAFNKELYVFKNKNQNKGN